MSKNSTAADWLAGSSEIVELIRSKDWSQTQLGPIEAWPENLQTTVSLCLASSFPINLAWGSGCVQVCNEGYARVCGDKHPGELGSDYRECWASAWPAIGEAFEQACAGETAYLENQPMFLDRHGYVEETATAGSIGFPQAPLDGCHVYVLADRRRLKQVLVNLPANAVKYNLRGGDVSVRRHPASASRLRIVIADSGVGIAEEDLDRLFVPFERLDAEGTAAEGTGLGLARSKSLVEMMGGEITATSAVGSGSTFSIEFPAAHRPPDALPPASVEAAAQPPADSRARTILYVEDNPSNVKLVERVLELRPEIRLVVAMRGGLGLDLAREHDPCLILLDLNLPDISGEEVLRQLKLDPQTVDTPVVVVSADATPGQRDRLRSKGAAEYLSKPFEVSRLLEIVDRAALRP